MNTKKLLALLLALVLVLGVLPVAYAAASDPATGDDTDIDVDVEDLPDVSVLYGDAVIIGDVPAIGELAEVYDEYGLGVVGVKEVPRADVSKYCSLKVDKINDKIMRVSDMIEKPKDDEIMSCYSILGRCILPAEIFTILENTERGAGGELQLTDAMKTLAVKEGMMGIDFSGTRYDMGNKFSYMQANVEMALKNPEFGNEFRNYIKEIAKTL